MGRMANFSLFFWNILPAKDRVGTLLVGCLCIHIYWVVASQILFIFTPIPGKMIYFD